MVIQKDGGFIAHAATVGYELKNNVCWKVFTVTVEMHMNTIINSVSELIFKKIPDRVE